jgi:alpha-galactosidase
MLRKLVPPTGQCARFENEDFTVGITPLSEGKMVSVFNWGDDPVSRAIKLEKESRLTDYWTGEDLGVHREEFRFPDMPARSARLIQVTPVSQ